MTRILSSRLARLEKQTATVGPYAQLSDDELQARLITVTAEIEELVGMTVSAFADALSKTLDHGEPFPDGWSSTDLKGYVSQLRRSAHGW